MESLDLVSVRRLALARAGLLKPEWTGFPTGGAGRGARARRAAHAVIGRFGYLQLDTVSVAGARSHALILMSRLEGMDPALAEDLLVPGAPLFEYWAHAVCWIPMDLYPVLGFRRGANRSHPWWGDLLRKHPGEAAAIRRRVRETGPFRSADLEGKRTGPWWGLKTSKKVAEALWSSGELAIRERRNFQRTYDLAERVIPADLLAKEVPEVEAVRTLVLLAFRGHGWAEKKTVSDTFHLRTTRPSFRAAFRSLEEEGAIVPCSAEGSDGVVRQGWVRPEDLELAARLRRVRPRPDRGVLLTPFDPLLWDRGRVRQLFGFEQVLEIYVPPAKRRFGYFCLPVLAGERIVARADLKADRRKGEVRVLSCRFEEGAKGRPPAADREAARAALKRHADALGMALRGAP